MPKEFDGRANSSHSRGNTLMIHLLYVVLLSLSRYPLACLLFLLLSFSPSSSSYTCYRLPPGSPPPPCHSSNVHFPSSFLSFSLTPYVLFLFSCLPIFRIQHTTCNLTPQKASVPEILLMTKKRMTDLQTNGHRLTQTRGNVSCLLKGNHVTLSPKS